MMYFRPSLTISAFVIFIFAFESFENAQSLTLRDADNFYPCQYNAKLFEIFCAEHLKFPDDNLPIIESTSKTINSIKIITKVNGDCSGNVLTGIKNVGPKGLNLTLANLNYFISNPDCLSFPQGISSLKIAASSFKSFYSKEKNGAFISFEKSFLVNLPKAKDLHIEYIPIDHLDINAFQMWQGAKELEELTFSHNNMRSIGYHPDDVLPQLVALIFIKQPSLESLLKSSEIWTGAFPNLKSLGFGYMVNPSSLHSLKINQNVSLIRLELEECGLSEIPNLKDCKDIVSLNLNGNRLVGDYTELKELKNLRYLYLANTGEISSDKRLDFLDHLEKLVLSGNRFETLDCTMLPRRVIKLDLDKAEILKLNSNLLDDKGIKILYMNNIKNFKAIQIDNGQGTWKSVLEKAKTTLGYLYLSGNNLDDLFFTKNFKKLMLPELLFIGLKDNSLTRFSTFMTFGSMKLMLLNISKNKIASLTENCLEEQESMMIMSSDLKINVSHNEISILDHCQGLCNSKISSLFLEVFIRKLQIDVSHNPFVCDCRSAWFSFEGLNRNMPCIDKAQNRVIKMSRWADESCTPRISTCSEERTTRIALAPVQTTEGESEISEKTTPAPVQTTPEEREVSVHSTEKTTLAPVKTIEREQGYRKGFMGFVVGTVIGSIILLVLVIGTVLAIWLFKRRNSKPPTPQRGSGVYSDPQSMHSFLPTLQRTLPPVPGRESLLVSQGYLKAVDPVTTETEPEMRNLFSN